MLPCFYDFLVSCQCDFMGAAMTVVVVVTILFIARQHLSVVGLNYTCKSKVAVYIELSPTEIYNLKQHVSSPLDFRSFIPFMVRFLV